MFLLSFEFVVARFANPDLLVDLHLWNHRLVLAAGAAEQLSTGAAVMPSLVDGEFDAAAQTRLGTFIFAPMVNHA